MSVQRMLLTIGALMLCELLGRELVGIAEEEAQLVDLFCPARLLALHQQLEGRQVVVLGQQELDHLGRVSARGGGGSSDGGCLPSPVITPDRSLRS